ncbi:MAG: PilZ domain-containing protein [Myxococcota bacterium]
MQLSSERRNPQLTRVPLDDVLVDLSPEGTHESFPADGLNVGVGGLSMRASILPDVGSKLRCRFQSPHDGESVDADCEVVWAEANGPNVGEFGMRFTGISDQDQSRIEALVDAWSSEMLTERALVSLDLDGVGSPLEGEVAADAGDVLVVEQPLPFLRIGTGISEGQRRGTLQGVDLRFEDDLPRLVLTVQFGDNIVPIAFEDEAGDTLLEGAAPLEPEKFETPRFAMEAPVEDAARSRESAQAVQYAVDDELAIEAAELRPSLFAGFKKFAAAFAPLLRRVRPWAVALWTRLAPRLKALGGQTRRFLSALVARAGAAIGALVRVKKKTRRTTGNGTPARSKKGRLRWVLLAGVLLVGLAYAFSNGDADADALEGSPEVVSATPAPAPEPEPAIDPEIGDDPAPALEARPSSEPGQTPASSPYAQTAEPAEAPSAEQVESGTIENGRSYTLRMSLPPRGMRGQDTEDGIRVVVLGSNAIDGARRIASADPRIASASILNHGEEAELRLRFSEGERPGYRIESRSSTLVITVGD